MQNNIFNNSNELIKEVNIEKLISYINNNIHYFDDIIIDIDEISDLDYNSEAKPTEQVISTPVNNSKHFDTGNAITISDSIYDGRFFQKDNKLYTRSGVIVGQVDLWIDVKNKIPKRYKDQSNIVLHPTTRERLYLYTLYPGFKMYHMLEPKTYKPYRFVLDNLISTDYITYS